ncbi:transporter substrate-binding domain-containing protein [Shewanella acanthi]|uniref:transporter substrate-binding domain-containing protein n=1 Tax=Shewanella acanthi TaxID=2864212 RepID=UPI001C65F536|nr:transporter substrate-binding domain-containing protein [Shewanella acanthi]QYJ77357.1 transporter substrate-binding domain-containing protein [Shewanella acanthi]
MKFVLPLLSMLFCLALGYTPKASSETHSPLIIVMGEDTFPYQYVDNEGEPTGLLVELWKEWGRQNNSELVFVARHWQDSLEQLEQGKAQIHIGMGQTPEREQRFDFAEPISDVGTYLYLHKSLQGKKSIHELIPYQIGIVSGSSHEEELRRIEPQIAFKYYESREKLLAGVASGETVVFAGLEGYLKDPYAVQAIAANFPVNQRIQIKASHFVPAVKKGNSALIKQINQGFKRLDPQIIRQLERRWLGYYRQNSGLVIAMHLGVEPFVDVGLDGLPHGLFVDMWKLWSEKTGITIDFISGDMNTSVNDVRLGLADAHIGYPESDELKTGLNRAWPLYTVKSRLFMFEPVSEYEKDLLGKRIGVLPTSTYLVELKKALPDVTFRYYDSLESMVEASQKGDIAGFMAPSAWTAHYLLMHKSWAQFSQYPALEFLTQVYVLTRSDDPGLAQRIVNGFNNINVQEFARLEQKWMLNPRDHIFKMEDKSQLLLSEAEKEYLAGLNALKLGYLKQWPPMEFSDAKGQFSGINSDIAKLIADELNITIEPVAFKDWNELIAALQRGDIDLAGSVAKTAERQQRLAFSDPYWPSPWGLVSTLEHVAMFNMSQLAGQRVAVVEGYHLVAQLMALQPSLKLIMVPNVDAGLEAVAKGKADVFIDKVITLASELKQQDYPKLKMALLSDLTEQQSHFGFSTQLSPLVPLVNKALERLDSQRQQQIYNRWVTESTFDTSVSGLKWYSYLLGLLILCGLLLLLWGMNRRLKVEMALRRSAESRLQHAHDHDSLTRLPNRLLFDDRLSQAQLFHTREHCHFALLLINLDRFKRVNKQFGHGVGDALLQSVAELLEQSCRDSDTVARLGDDEFAILLQRVQSRDAAGQVADNILHALSKTFVIEGAKVQIGASIGVVLYPDDADTSADLLNKASSLLQDAKSDGGHCYRVA